ncbi:MAG: ParA family protein [Pyrobaculum sp.]
MRPVKTVVVYSLDGGVGRTTLSAVLSVARGYVLMVDMDWERAGLSQLFKAPRRPGWLAPYLGAGVPYVHRVSPTLYLIPGYEAALLYTRRGEDFAREVEEAFLDFAERLPALAQRLGIPVDLVIIDTAAALRLGILAEMRKMGVYGVFVGDRRLVSKISEAKAEQYRRYLAYSSVAVLNLLEKDELKIARKLTPAAIKRVAVRDRRGVSVAEAVLRDRENRKSIDYVLAALKTS